MTPVEDQLRQNIRALMKSRKMTQSDLAGALGRSQPWVSKRMTGGVGGNKWCVEDLDALEQVFQIAPWELLRPGHGHLDRRADQRRTVQDRRTLPQGVTLVAADRDASPFAQTEQVIHTANALYTAATQLQSIAAAIFRGYTAALGVAPPERAAIDRDLGHNTGPTDQGKTG